MSLGCGDTESRERGSAGALCPSSCPWASTPSAPAHYYNFSLSWGEWEVSKRLGLQVDGTETPPRDSQGAAPVPRRGRVLVLLGGICRELGEMSLQPRTKQFRFPSRKRDSLEQRIKGLCLQLPFDFLFGPQNLYLQVPVEGLWRGF